MSGNVRTYRSVRTALQQGYPTEPHGNLARPLNALAELVSGIVGSRRTHLPDMTKHAPDRTKRESRVKRFSRWVDDEGIEVAFICTRVICLIRYGCRARRSQRRWLTSGWFSWARWRSRRIGSKLFIGQTAAI